MKKKIRMGMIGGGPGAFIGDTHRKAARISNQYELIGGIFSSDPDKNRTFAVDEGLDKNRIYDQIEDMIENELKIPTDKRIEAVSLVTPNYLHYDHARLLLENGFHVICDKPVTMTSGEAGHLEELTHKTGLVFCLTHNYTGYPMVRQIREMIKNGELGDIQRIDVQYYQGWMNTILHGNDEDKKIWRLNPESTGIASCMADIGVHAFNLVEYSTSQEITKVLADLNKFSETIKLDLDGTILFRTRSDVHGVIRASQVANGEENGIMLSVYGSRSSIKWHQENPNKLYQISQGTPIKTYKPGNEYNYDFSRDSHTLPFGHPEGFYEAFANIYAGAAKAIRKEETHDGEFPGIYEGVRGMKFIESVVQSDKNNNSWTKL